MQNMKMTPGEYILALARSFPCLRHKLVGWKPEKFDADVLYKCSGPWSSGEKLCVLFVLNVWNPGYAKSQGWTFNLFDFVGTADIGNRAALQAWIDRPHWP